MAENNTSTTNGILPLGFPFAAVMSYMKWGGNLWTVFYEEIGIMPSPKHQVDRKNKGNVRWATRSQQTRNVRRHGGAKFRNPLGRYDTQGEPV